MNKSGSFRALALCAAAGLAGLFNVPGARAARAHAGDGSVRQVNATAPVSLADGQTLRVNFFNAGRSPFEIIPCVFDGDGLHLKTWEAITLAPGQTRSFDLSREEAGRRGDGSVRVRAGVHAAEPDLKHLVASGEVVEDATGWSSLFVPGAVALPDPVRTGENAPPDPISPGEVTWTLAPVGITAGQALRVTFLNTGGSPLEIVPCVFDGDGAHLKTGVPVRLAPGQIVSFEMSRAEAFMRDETRLVVRGAAHVRSADRKSLLVTGEVVEAATGRSSLFVSAASRVGFDPQPDPPATR